MERMQAYDPNNIFAKILRSELPSHKVFEDADTLAIMDIMPRADGHVLVMPKAHCRNILDVPADTLAATMQTVQKLAPAIKAAMKADGLTIQQFNESAGGQVVFHLHIHVIPRWENTAMQPHTGQMAPNDTLAKHAALISAQINASETK
jgi:histidine triad (HIT) family protein